VPLTRPDSYLFKGEEMKTCKICGQEKDINDFQKDNRRKDGHTSFCKKCASKRANDWHKKNRERHNKKMGIWRDKNKIQNPGNYLWAIAKRRAKEDSKPFSISKEDVRVPEFCPVLGVKLEFTKGMYSPNAPSIDCFIPELGYVKGNINVISHKANTMKSSATPDEIEKLYLWARAHVSSGT
jgi:hypothetical protein